ncbi:hypothetical protein ACFOKI_12035 [Sphingomonas qilianensis]|uniref:Uncharacterized protein n=1 Tax=Sphingomonas qilianensis TaxID=1736690 RepID=A0ABU9XNX1_9SPHN
MNASDLYSLLNDACQQLDDKGDHAIAAYVGLAMALVADKYDIDTDNDEEADGAHAAHLPKSGGRSGGSWA